MTRRDVLILLGVCALAYFTGLTNHGLTNWQEAMRAIVARDMQARADWLVPTVHAEPYLAKPPMIYWSQLGVNAVCRGQTGELELRLTVALAGAAGVLATYALTRRLLGATATPQAGRSSTPLIASILLASGFLYVRSARIGEIDILLVPSTLLGIGAIHAAWRSHLHRGRASLAAVAVAAVAAAAAALTKGPPGMLPMALGGYGGMVLWAAFSDGLGPAPRERLAGHVERLLMSLGAMLLVVPAISLNRAAGFNAESCLGMAAFVVFGSFLGIVVSRLLTSPARARALLRAFVRTHVVGVPATGLIALWIWGRAVASHVGDAEVAQVAAEEAADNLQLLVFTASKDNFEAMLYGGGLASVIALVAGLIGLRRLRWTPESSLLVAWIALSFIAFSTLGKGVPRYLTPIWPAVAIVAAQAISRVTERRLAVRRAVVAAGVLLAVGQGVWYGYARERFHADRSPRGIVRELLANGVGADELGTFEFSTPAVDFYADARVPSYLDIKPQPGIRYVGPDTIADLVERLEPGGSRVLLVRETQPPTMDSEPAIPRLERAGLIVRTIPLESGFVIDNGRTRIAAVRVSRQPAAANAGGRASRAPGS